MSDQTIHIPDDRDSAILSDVCRRVLAMTGGPGIDVRNGPGGITISLTPKRDYRPVQPASPGTFLCRITAVSGSFPAWGYTMQRVTGYDSRLTGQARWVTDGVDFTGINRTEFAGTAPYNYGTGSKITNASTGAVNSTACKIIAIGVGAVVDVTRSIDAKDGTELYSFSEMNSAQS